MMKELKSPVSSEKTSLEELLVRIFFANEAAFETFFGQIFNKKIEARNELFFGVVRVVDKSLILRGRVREGVAD